MARMSREFNLVLLGAGLLTAGYFLWPEQEPLKLDKEEAGGGAAGGSRRTGRVHHIIIFHSTTTAARNNPSRSFVSSPTTRGGFGSSGARFSGG
jgi:hypothetical protein